MPTIASLIDEAQAERLRRITTPEPAKPTHERVCTCDQRDRNDGMRLDGDVLVHAGCGLPRPKVAVLRGATTITPKITPKVTPKITKEKPMSVDVNEMPPAMLGETIKQAMREEISADLPEKRSKAERKAAKAAKRAKAEAAEARRTLLDMGVLEGFTLKGVDVPDLDVASIASIDEMPAKAFRSPYNKLRARHDEPLLPTKDEPAEPSCTWRDVIADHQRFALKAKQKRLTRPQIAAKVDATEKTKRKALKALGYSKSEIKQILATV